MLYFVAIGALLCGWAMLSLLGGERNRRLWQIKYEVDRAARAAAAAAAAKSAGESEAAVFVVGAAAPNPHPATKPAAARH